MTKAFLCGKRAVTLWKNEGSGSHQGLLDLLPLGREAYQKHSHHFSMPKPCREPRGLKGFPRITFEEGLVYFPNAQNYSSTSALQQPGLLLCLASSIGEDF